MFSICHIFLIRGIKKTNKKVHVVKHVWKRSHPEYTNSLTLKNVLSVDKGNKK